MNSFPERLRAARKKMGLSLQALADQMPVKISKQALSKYEAGAMEPSGAVLVALGKVLGVKADYFFRHVTLHLPPVAFRKSPSLPARQISIIKETVRDVLERYLEVEQLLQVKDVFHNPLKKQLVRKPEETDALAAQLLHSWRIGMDAIPNVIEMLEERGVRVIEIAASGSFDGMSTMVGLLPVIVLNESMPIERKRFTALHELGHIVLKIHQKADAEKICHAFAGAMLLPGDTLNRQLGHKRNNIAPGELALISEQYGISIQAIVMRALARGIIDGNCASRLFRSVGGSRKAKGLGRFHGNERSYRFEQMVFRLAAEEVVSLSKAASLAGMRLAQFKDRLDGRQTNCDT